MLRLHKGVILSLIVMIRYLPAIKDNLCCPVDEVEPAPGHQARDGDPQASARARLPVPRRFRAVEQ